MKLFKAKNLLFSQSNLELCFNNFLPFHSSSVDIFPPAFCRFPKLKRCWHASIVPLSIRSFFFAKSAPYCNYYLSVWALEIESLPEKINPLIIGVVMLWIIIIMLCPRCHHQLQQHTKQYQHHVVFAAGADCETCFMILLFFIQWNIWFPDVQYPEPSAVCHILANEKEKKMDVKSYKKIGLYSCERH